MTQYLELQKLVDKLRQVNGYPFLEGYKARVLDLAQELQFYINKGFYIADAKSQARRSLNPDKYDIFCDLSHELIERVQGVYKEPKPLLETLEPMEVK